MSKRAVTGRRAGRSGRTGGDVASEFAAFQEFQELQQGRRGTKRKARDISPSGSDEDGDLLKFLSMKDKDLIVNRKMRTLDDLDPRMITYVMVKTDPLFVRDDLFAIGGRFRVLQQSELEPTLKLKNMGSLLISR